MHSIKGIVLAYALNINYIIEFCEKRLWSSRAREGKTPLTQLRRLAVKTLLPDGLVAMYKSPLIVLSSALSRSMKTVNCLAEGQLVGLMWIWWHSIACSRTTNTHPCCSSVFSFLCVLLSSSKKIAFWSWAQFSSNSWENCDKVVFMDGLKVMNEEKSYLWKCYDMSEIPGSIMNITDNNKRNRQQNLVVTNQALYVQNTANWWAYPVDGLSTHCHLIPAWTNNLAQPLP